MTFDMRGDVSIHVDASPEAVYDLLSNITRMGEWSPECVNVAWADGSPEEPVVGARFNGTNRAGDNEWTTPNEILVADRGREFAWCVGVAGFEVTTWRFRFEAANGGTDVNQSFELGEPEIGFRKTVMEMPEADRAAAIDARRTQLLGDMGRTLDRIKANVESGVPR